MDRLLLASAAVVVGAVVVGPLLSHAALRWIGWRGVVPLLLGWDPLRSEIGSTRPVCRACGAALAPAGLPVLPWLAVRGRCRRCGAPIGRWVLGVEVATGVGFGVVAARFGWSVELLPMLVLVAGLVAASAVDLMCGRIPTRFMRLTAAALVGSIVVAVLVDGEPGSLWGAVVGAAVYLAVLGSTYLIAMVRWGPLGLGDVRLGVVTGLAVGWLGWLRELDRLRRHPIFDEGDTVLLGTASGRAALLGLIVSMLAVVVVGLAQRRFLRRRQPYPVGPWLSLGGLVAALLVA